MLLKMDEEGGRRSLLSRGLFWLDRSQAAGLGAGVGLGLGAGAAYLGLPYGLPLGVLVLGGAALLGLTGSEITVPLDLPMREDGRDADEGPPHPTPRE